MPTPEPMAVSVGIISNFLACEGQRAKCLKFPLTVSQVRNYNKSKVKNRLPVTAQ